MASKKPSAPNKAFVRKDPQRWKKTGWTSVPNSIIHDETLPPEEAWAWAWMASHTETFEVSGEKLWHANEHVSKNKAYDLLRNLEERGMLLRTHEATSDGVPYIVYDLQPVPVPPEERTHKPRKPKPKKSFPTLATDDEKPQDSTVSRTVGNPGVTSDAPKGHSFPDGRESGSDQGEQGSEGVDPTGRVSPARVSPDQSGESYKEYKTNGKDQPNKLGCLDGDASPGNESQDAGGEDSNHQRALSFLESLKFDDGTKIVAYPDVVAQLQALLDGRWTEQEIADRLKDSGGARVANWGGFARHKLMGLAPKPELSGRSTGAAGEPAWCGECEEGSRRDQDGKRCRNCHVRYAKVA